MNISLAALKFFSAGAHVQCVLTHRGRRFVRDEEGAWRDEAGRQPDLATCFALSDKEKQACSPGREAIC